MSPTEPLPDAESVRPARTPRVGELSAGWRIVTGITWVLVVVALGSVWKTSDQLGLSTWWLGPRGRPNSLAVQLLPFLPAVLMVLAAINHVKHLPWFGLGASALVILTGLFDLDRVVGLAIVEIAIGVAAAIVSLVSLTGVYRVDPAATVQATVAEPAAG
jgi:hypothetical protein